MIRLSAVRRALSKLGLRMTRDISTMILALIINALTNSGNVHEITHMKIRTRRARYKSIIMTRMTTVVSMHTVSRTAMDKRW